MDSSLLSFISDIQLQLKNKQRSDAILRTLCLYAEKKIPRSTCLTIVFSLLRSHAALTQKFAAIVEEIPPPLSRSGCLTDDPYLITAIEYELWPNALKQFLLRIRDVMLRRGNLLDAFVFLEHVKPTSGPFWLLWELFKPISQTNHFMQLIYDGCVKLSYIPPYLKTDIPPSQADLNPSAITHQKIVDSEVVCTYPSDIWQPFNPIGRKKIGSYGLLPPEKVDCTCSGRRVSEYCACNDRWAISAAGLDCNFKFVQKNQYEDRIYDNEDERVQMDVAITRMRSSILRLTSLKTAILDPRIKIDTSSFPQCNLTPLDFLTLEDIYGPTNLDSVLFAMTQNPVKMLDTVIERTSEKMNDLSEFRRQKEPEYHEFNKRNIKKSLDKKNEPVNQTHQTNVSVKEEDPFETLKEGKERTFSFDLEHVTVVNEIINRCCRFSMQHMQVDVAPTLISRFLMVFLGFQEKSNSNTVFSLIPTSCDGDDLETHYMTIPLYKMLFYYWQLTETVSFILRESFLITNNSSSENSEEIKNIIKPQGIKVAAMLGYISNNNIANVNSSVVKETLIELIPNYYSNQKHVNSLESNFEIPSQSPLPNLDSIRKCLMSFMKAAQSVAMNTPSLEIVEATQVSDKIVYRAMCLAAVSGLGHFRCKLNSDDEKVTVTIKGYLPKCLKQSKTVRVYVKNKNCVQKIDRNDINAHQETFKNLVIQKRGKMKVRNVLNELCFRMDYDGLQFKNSGADFIRPEQK